MRPNAFSVRLPILAALLAWGAVLSALAAGPVLVPNRIQPKLEAFDYGDVQLLPGPLENAFEANRRYLRSLSPDRLLWAFRTTAGLPAPGKPYGGWEAADIEVRGHFLGHYLSACARTIRVSGDPELKKNADYTVAELAKCQAKMGSGYLAAFPDSFFDRVEQLKPVWAPYYTIHKILLGLLEMHRYAGNERALETAEKMADYFAARAAKLDDAAFQKMLRNEYGGMQEALLNLYAATGKEKYLQLGERFEKRMFIDPLRDGKDVLPMLHANTHIPQIAGAARRYELTGDADYRKAVEFFWTRVAETQSFATGGSNWDEHWLPSNQLSQGLGVDSQEFCTSYNWEKINRYLLGWTGDARYGDMVERNFYNGILVSQNPKTGMLLYMLPLGPGSRKHYGNEEDTFTCCHGTGVQQYSTLGEGIYFRSAEGQAPALYVNLFAASAVTWKLGGETVKVTQRTSFPDEAVTRLAIETEKPARFALRIRVPWWANGGIQVAVNGKPVARSVSALPGAWAEVEREWKKGDRVEVRLPMRLWTQAINDDPNLRAVLYGPVVLAGLVDSKQYRRDRKTPVVTGDAQKPESWIKPVAGKPLTFRTAGQPADMTLMPLYRTVEENYGVYFRFAAAGSEAASAYAKAVAAEKAREARTADYMTPGDPASEKAHAIEEAKTGDWHQEFIRELRPDGWVSYRMKPGATLAVAYEAGAKLGDLKVSVDGTPLQPKTAPAGKGYAEVEYAVPAALASKSAVTVRVDFIPKPGSEGGHLYGLTMLRAQ